MRKSCVLLICIVLLVSGLISSVPAEPIDEIKISQITYINTDWTISDTQVRENKTIILTGNLTIQSDPKHKEELAKILAVMDDMLDNLPEDVIEQFAKSDDFKLYEKIMDLYLEENE